MKVYLKFLGKLLLFLKEQLIGFDRPFRDEQTANRFHEKFVEFLKTFVLEQRDRNAKFLRMFIASPASKSHHQNYKGGLFEHCYFFAAYLYSRTNEGGYRGDVPLTLTIKECFRIALSHDFCKVGLYKKMPDGNYYYNPNIKGHAKLSVSYIEKLGYVLTTAERVCILLHMAGGWYNAEDYAALTPEDLAWKNTHDADIAAVQWADMKAC